MLDLLVYVTKGLSCVTTKMREEGKEVGKDVNHLVTVNLFTTITNVENSDWLATRSSRASRRPHGQGRPAGRAEPWILSDAWLPAAALWNGGDSEFDAKAGSDEVGVLATENEDIRSLREMITYGLKGPGSLSSSTCQCAAGDNEDYRCHFPERNAGGSFG